MSEYEQQRYLPTFLIVSNTFNTSITNDTITVLPFDVAILAIYVGERGLEIWRDRLI